MVLTASLAMPTSPIHLSPRTAAKLDCKGGDPSLFLPHGWGGALARIPHTMGGDSSGELPVPGSYRCQGAGAAEPRGRVRCVAGPRQGRGASQPVSRSRDGPRARRGAGGFTFR